MDVARHTPVDPRIAAYLADHFVMHPHQAIKAGLHQLDGNVADWSSAAIARRVANLHAHRAALAPLAAEPLALHEAGTGLLPLNQTMRNRWDARLALTDAQAELVYWTQWRPYETNPLAYLPALDISPYVKRRYAPLAARVRALTRHLAAIPDLLQRAHEHLHMSIAHPILQQSIVSFDGLAKFHASELVAIVRQVPERGLFDAFEKVNRAAVTAYRGFVARLRARTSDPQGSLALGAATLRALLAAGELVDLPLDDLRALGIADLARNHARMQAVSARLGLTPAAAMADLGRQHPPVAQILPGTRAQMEELHQFILDRAIVTIPNDNRCLVQETLPFMRTGSAFMDAPGPFEPPGAEAYFYLTLPDPAWPVAEQESWLAKQSIPGLANTAIHEVWPGHFLQFLHLAQAPTQASKLFTCVSFTEGWAHYAEQMMVEQGYHANDPRYELQQLSMALLRDCRFLVALNLHTDAMTVDEAAEFIAREAFFTPIRAQQEAIRGTRDPAYLNYTLGKLLLLEVRDAVRQAYPHWSTRTLHDAFLGFGAPPIPLLRELLLSSVTPRAAAPGLDQAAE